MNLLSHKSALLLLVYNHSNVACAFKNTVAAAFCIALAGYVEMRPLIYLVGAAAVDACNVDREEEIETGLRLQGVGGARDHIESNSSDEPGQRRAQGQGKAGTGALTTTSVLSPSNRVFGRSLVRYA